MRSGRRAAYEASLDTAQPPWEQAGKAVVQPRRIAPHRTALRCLPPADPPYSDGEGIGAGVQHRGGVALPPRHLPVRALGRAQAPRRRGQRRLGPLGASLVQARVYLDVDVATQGVGDRTDLLGLLGRAIESFRVQARHAPVYVDDHRGDLQLVDIEGAYRADVQLFWLVALLGEGVGKRHSVAARVRRRDQLLGAGLAVRTLRARGPRDRHV